MQTHELIETHEPQATNVGRRRIGVALALFVAIALLIIADLIGDAEEGADLAHLLLEGFIMAAAVGGVGALWKGLQTAQARAVQLGGDLEAARLEAARYREEASDALRGLGEAIDSQFTRWALTPAEREIGLLLLKGLSHREVAELRHTTEPTVRQQALMVYRKSGLRNRSDLSAFFLEDLLLPRDSSPDSRHT